MKIGIFTEIFKKIVFPKMKKKISKQFVKIEEHIAELDPEFNLLLYQDGPGGHKPLTAEDFQFRLWTDRYRGSELLFQPSIIGLECAVLSEALETLM
jgi:hypothetical protein